MLCDDTFVGFKEINLGHWNVCHVHTYDYTLNLSVMKRTTHYIVLPTDFCKELEVKHSRFF